MSGADAFFIDTPEGLAPGPHAVGPWAPNMLHGRLLAGVAGWAIERDHRDDSFQFTRLTVDLFRSPPMEPIEVTTEMVREGGRVRVVQASLSAGGMEVARASAQMLRRGPHPEGKVWHPEGWSVPKPDEIEPLPRGDRPGSMVWDMRPITPGGFGAMEQRRLWMREMRVLIEGEPLTPFVRVAMVADFTNPFTNFSETGLSFINADLTLYLRRSPHGEWIGFEAAGHLGEEGVAVGHANLYDTEGAIGHCSVAAIAAVRMPPS